MANGRLPRGRRVTPPDSGQDSGDTRLRRPAGLRETPGPGGVPVIARSPWRGETRSPSRCSTSAAQDRALGAGRFPIRVSIGGALAHAGEPLEALFVRADQALPAAKGADRNGSCSTSRSHPGSAPASAACTGSSTALRLVLSRIQVGRPDSGRRDEPAKIRVPLRGWMRPSSCPELWLRRITVGRSLAPPEAAHMTQNLATLVRSVSEAPRRVRDSTRLAPEWRSAQRAAVQARLDYWDAMCLSWDVRHPQPAASEFRDEDRPRLSASGQDRRRHRWAPAPRLARLAADGEPAPSVSGSSVARVA